MADNASIRSAPALKTMPAGNGEALLASSERHAFRSLTSCDDGVMGVVLKMNRIMRTENCELEKPAFFCRSCFSPDRSHNSHWFFTKHLGSLESFDW